MVRKVSRSAPSGGKNRFRTWEELATAATRLQELARKEDIEIVLVGGFALQLLGSTRLTGDVDIASRALLPGLKVGKRLSFGGYKTKVEGVPVDVIVRLDDYAPLYEEAIDYAIVVERFRIAPPEYIAAMKMASGRMRDMADLEFLVGEKIINLKATETIIRDFLGVYAAREEWPQLVREILWRKGRK